MIKSCKECKTPCCQCGPGPYKLMTPESYLESFGEVSAYNTKCMALDEKGQCRLWGTKDLPTECRTYVCQTRRYSKKELEVIDAVDDSRECPCCDMSYMLVTVESNGEDWRETCERCGYTFVWVKDETK